MYKVEHRRMAGLKGFRVEDRIFKTLQEAKDFADKVFRTHNIVVAITYEADPAFQKIMPMPTFPSIRK
jgi:hypothetical protein